MDQGIDQPSGDGSRRRECHRRVNLVNFNLTPTPHEASYAKNGSL